MSSDEEDVTVPILWSLLLVVSEKNDFKNITEFEKKC